MKYFIPARKNSVGFKNKNRILMGFTFQILDDIKWISNDEVIVFTDDNIIKNTACSYNFSILDRPPQLSTGNESIKELFLYLINERDINDDIMLLYLTHPFRNIDIITSIYNYYKNNNYKSLLCLEPVNAKLEQLLIYDNKWTKLVNNNKFRRQQYTNIMKLVHYIAIINSNEINNLDDVLYNDHTGFYILDKNVVDIDYKEDLWP